MHKLYVNLRKQCVLIEWLPLGFEPNLIIQQESSMDVDECPSKFTQWSLMFGLRRVHAMFTQYLRIVYV